MIADSDVSLDMEMSDLGGRTITLLLLAPVVVFALHGFAVAITVYVCTRKRKLAVIGFVLGTIAAFAVLFLLYQIGVTNMLERWTLLLSAGITIGVVAVPIIMFEQKETMGGRGGEKNMRTLTILGIGMLTVIVLLACAWTYHTHSAYEDTYRSEYRYEVTVRMDSTLHNVTLYVPLPVAEDGSEIGEEIVAKNASIHTGWDCDIVETEHGQMLKIHIEEMISDLHAPPVPLPEDACGPDALSCPAQTSASERVSAVVQADREINTKTPAGNEPTLSPKYNLTRSVYMMPHPKDRTPPTRYEYESRIYADYTASPDAEVSIHVELTGENTWWVYGWSGNKYRDHVGMTLTGAQDGWCAASGNLVAGEGRYW